MASLSTATRWVLLLTLLALCCTTEAARRSLQPTTLAEAEAALQEITAKAAKEVANVAKAKASLATMEASCSKAPENEKFMCPGKQRAVQSMIDAGQKLLEKYQEAQKQAQKTFDDLSTPEDRQKRLDAIASLKVAEKNLVDATAAREAAQENLDKAEGECGSKPASVKVKSKPGSANLICLRPAKTALDNAITLEKTAATVLENVKELVKPAKAPVEKGSGKTKGGGAVRPDSFPGGGSVPMDIPPVNKQE